MADPKATISLSNSETTIELPVLDGSEGPQVIDVRSLGGAGYFTYVPGFMATAACEL